MSDSNPNCPYCRDSGRYEFIDPDCPNCKGKGLIQLIRNNETTTEHCHCRRWVDCKHFRKWDKQEKFSAQTKILRQALDTPTHSLDELLRLMRNSGEPVAYLAGTRLDNAYCFGSDDVGILLSALPQDANKAAEPGFHPGSTEMYVTFQGTLTMECLEDAPGGERKVMEKTVGHNPVLVLPPGQCHRVRFDPQREAASVIVKTSLHAKPSVVRCKECTYYPDPAECPLAQNWTAEKSARERASV